MRNKDNMSKIMSDDDKINRYLQGSMSVDEEVEFVEEMKADTDLRQNAITQARLIKGMKDADMELIDAFKDADGAYIDSIITNSKRMSASDIMQYRRKFSLIKCFSTAAAIAIIITGSYKGYDYYKTTRLARQYADTFSIQLTTRGNSGSNAETELLILFNNIIKRRDLKNTILRLEKLWNLSQQDKYNDYTDYGPYIGWYLAIGYLEDYEKSKAIRFFEKMKNQYSNNPIIIDKINELNSNLR